MNLSHEIKYQNVHYDGRPFIILYNQTKSKHIMSKEAYKGNILC